MSFQDKNGTIWRNLQEQVLKNKEDIYRLFHSEITLAEFGITVMGVTDTFPTEPPVLIPGDVTTYGYAYLIIKEGGTYDLAIWTREQDLSEGTWVNLGEFPAKGPKGDKGGKGDKGDAGTNGLNGERGATIKFGPSQPSPSVSKTGDLYLDPNQNLYRFATNVWIYEGSLKGEAGATGQKGADGITPQIGANGNWFIGTTDTGYRAIGVDGESFKVQAGIYTPSTLPNFSTTEVGDAFVVSMPEGGQSLYYHGFGGTQYSVITNWGGVPGPQGVGLPAGGNKGQVLRKHTDVNYDFEWTTLYDDITIYNTTFVEQDSDNLDYHITAGPALTANSLIGIRIPSTFNSTTAKNVYLVATIPGQGSVTLRLVQQSPSGAVLQTLPSWSVTAGQIMLISVISLVNYNQAILLENNAATAQYVKETIASSKLPLITGYSNTPGLVGEKVVIPSEQFDGNLYDGQEFLIRLKYENNTENVRLKIGTADPVQLVRVDTTGDLGRVDNTLTRLVHAQIYVKYSATQNVFILLGVNADWQKSFVFRAVGYTTYEKVYGKTVTGGYSLIDVTESIVPFAIPKRNVTGALIVPDETQGDTEAINSHRLKWNLQGSINGTTGLVLTDTARIKELLFVTEGFFGGTNIECAFSAVVPFNSGVNMVTIVSSTIGGDYYNIYADISSGSDVHMNVTLGSISIGGIVTKVFSR